VSSRRSRSASTISVSPSSRPAAVGPGGIADHGTELDPAQPGVDLETDPAGLVGREQPAALLSDAATQLQVGPLEIDHVDRGPEHGRQVGTEPLGRVQRRVGRSEQHRDVVIASWARRPVDPRTEQVRDIDAVRSEDRRQVRLRRTRAKGRVCA
jgi:hypothetical protein